MTGLSLFPQLDGVTDGVRRQWGRMRGREAVCEGLTPAAAALFSPREEGEPSSLQVAASSASGDGGLAYPQWAGSNRRKGGGR